jgi:hypothetical protein
MSVYCVQDSDKEIPILKLPTSFWLKSFILLRSRLGNCITSVFNLCSAASPLTGLLPAPVVGLSFALTQLATPWSGISRVTFPYIADISWLCRCSISPAGVIRKPLIRAASSTWFSWPGGRRKVSK